MFVEQSHSVSKEHVMGMLIDLLIVARVRMLLLVTTFFGAACSGC